MGCAKEEKEFVDMDNNVVTVGGGVWKWKRYMGGGGEW